MLRSAILAAADSARVERLLTTAPVTRSVVDRFVAGRRVEDAVRVAKALVADGLHVSLDRLGEDVHDTAQATAAVDAYVALLHRLRDEVLTPATEVSVKLTALGARVHPRLGLDGAREVCAAAAEAGTTVTIDMEDSSTTDPTLVAVRTLREEFPTTGAVVQSYLYRTEADCRALARPGSRVRLCKGAYAEPATVAYQDAVEIRKSYVRCMKALFDGGAYPMLATHDPVLLAVSETLTAERPRDSYEIQMLYGVRPDEQRRQAREGKTVRVYVPYGDQWYGYLMRRLAERPANLAFFARALVSRS